MRKSKTEFIKTTLNVPKEHFNQVNEIASKEQEDAAVIWRRVIRNGLKKEEIRGELG